MATSSSSSSTKNDFLHRHPTHFTPIEEGNEDEELSQGRSSFRATPSMADRRERGKAPSRKRQESDKTTGVSCNQCRPSNREKFSVVPLESNGVHRHRLMASPNAIFKSVLGSFALKKSPRSSEGGSSAASREEQWKFAVAELSNKLILASRKRDEAVLEASKLKYSVAELEKKLNKLEIYCHSLKSGLEVCSSVKNSQTIKVGDHQEKVVEHFLILVSEARSSVRILTRVLTLQLRQMGGKQVYDRIALLLQPYDIKISYTRGILLYFEALLNRAFFEDFESIGFQKGAPNTILNPIDRCEANFAMFSRLQGLAWEEVLGKGTRHFSEDFSKFCDRKMSEIVAMLGWDRAWPEPVLQAFFGASKAVWLVHLLANSVHPGLPIFRVDSGVRFDPVYMEDMGGDHKAKKLTPNMVRVMVTPGFYVYNNVVKSKVHCRYHNNHLNDMGLTPSPL
ncbi:IRK-interacting protein [Sesamum alatum]|uniref:IRK-interacting protein n=1 Tax=Sesamum alatum TaxID=300844 RepID=A0AAE1Y3Z1_9LAMI|nr:IRK-interacting protein [Sesamum alatum]